MSDDQQAWGPSALCAKGEHGWCMNRTPQESNCTCPCHGEKQERKDRATLARLKAKYEPASPASLDLHALARETADQLVFYINGETAKDYPASYDIILSALQRARDSK